MAQKEPKSSTVRNFAFSNQSQLRHKLLRYRVDWNSTMVEIQTVITRQNRVQLRRTYYNLSCLVSSTAVLMSQSLFSSQSLIST